MKTIIFFIALFAVICFVSVCLSQTFDRTSMSHYLCLVSSLMSLSGASWWVFKLEEKKHGPVDDE
jgi:hypothetical protein